MGALIVFSVSGTALLACITFKLYERTHTLSSYTAARAAADKIVVKYVHQAAIFLARVEEHVSVKGIVFAGVRTIATGVARTAKVIEYRAHRLVRATAHHHVLESAAATRSSFLQQVSSHKKSLDTERIKRETSLTPDEE